MEDKSSANAALKKETIKKMMKDIEPYFGEEANEDKKHKIYDILSQYNELDTIKKYENLKIYITKSIEDNEEELLELLIGEEIQYTEGIYYKINKIKKEASLFMINCEITNFTVPCTIQYNNEHYLVTSIIGSVNITGSLQFESNSSVHTFYRNAFGLSRVKEIFIPDNLRTIKEGCFCETFNLTKLIISPKNDRFLYQDDQYLLGKTDEKSDNYDVLIFARRDISEAKIPSNIKIISAFAFDHCHNLRTITFEENSKLEIIEKYAFSSSNIEEIFIPANLRELKECFGNLNKLIKFKISPKNDRFLYQDDQYLLGKTDEKSDNYDVLIFARRDISEAKIPSNIKIISAFAFDNCKNLRTITFEENSKLEIIDKYAFSFSNIEEIFIPANVSIISECAFYACKYLQNIKIEENSKLEIIGKWAFTSSKIEAIFIPSNVSKISDYAFYACFDLQNVKIEENSKLKTIGKCVFSDSKIEEIFIPSILKIKDGCFYGADKLRKFIISPKNDRFLYQDDQYLLGKTDEKSDNYDVLIFARRDISKAKIPSNIKIISSHAFGNSQNLRTITFEENSKLEIIEEKAFSFSNIEEIFIPANVSEISYNAFYFCQELKIIGISEGTKLDTVNDLSINLYDNTIIMVPVKKK